MMSEAYASSYLRRFPNTHVGSRSEAAKNKKILRLSKWPVLVACHVLVACQARIAAHHPKLQAAMRAEGLVT
jgi:hypothetical protein